MLKATSLVHDLRLTAVTAATNAIATHGRAGMALSPAAVQAGLEAALPFLLDAKTIEDAMLLLDRQQPREESAAGRPTNC